MSTESTWRKATAIAPGPETITAIFEHGGSTATRDAEAARLLLEQWTPGRLILSSARGSGSMARLAAYGIKMVSIEQQDATDHTSPSTGGKPAL